MTISNILFNENSCKKFIFIKFILFNVYLNIKFRECDFHSLELKFKNFKLIYPLN